MLHIATLSSGAASAYTAQLMIDEVGRDNCQAIFTDTLVEDADNYRFLDEIVAHLGVPYFRLCEGKTPLELAWSEHALPSDLIPFCSRKLKREPMERYIEELQDAENIHDITLWWGIGVEESHRAVAIGRNWLANYNIHSRFPLIEQTVYHNRPFEWLEEIGIKRPRMYDEGFQHANCGMQGCVRGGLNHWALLYDRRPDVYAQTEALEQQWQRDFGKHNTILRITRDGVKSQISLKDFREQHLENKPLFNGDFNQDLFPTEPKNACGCMAQAFEAA